jgi:hypothetical protein
MLNRKAPALVGAGLAVALLLAVLCLAPVGAAAAEEVETHTFDATLSLTGNCATNELDPVPDPGCPEGTHPSRRFKVPRGPVIDQYGDIYLASAPINNEGESLIDIFNPNGELITEIDDGHGAMSLAIDSTGHLYAYRFKIAGAESETGLFRYDPTVYDPEAGRIEYDSPPTQIVYGREQAGVAVDPSNDHVYLVLGGLQEYGSAAEGNPLLDASVGGIEPSTNHTAWVAVNGATHELYIDARGEGALEKDTVVKVYSTEGEHPFIRTIDGSCVPEGHFSAGYPGIAIDESDGHVFVDNRGTENFSSKYVYEFTEDGECVSTIGHSFEFAYISTIAIDNGAHSPNGALNPNGRYLFVPSGEIGTKSHLYAFAPVSTVAVPPQVESLTVGNVSESEADLRATVNPEGTATHWAIQYTTQGRFEAEGYASASTAGEGDLPAGSVGHPVAASVTGLSPGTHYRFRVVASGSCGPEPCVGEGEAQFATYSGVAQSGGCPNAALRGGKSAVLPDCRAYELVTPADTNGFVPESPLTQASLASFGTPTATADGSSLAFIIAGGGIPGFTGTGSYNGDLYLAARTASGWQSAYTGPDAAQSSFPAPGGLSADHSVSTFNVRDETFEGSLDIGERREQAVYLRVGDGRFVLVGTGSLATAPEVRLDWVTPGASHAVFQTKNSGSSWPFIYRAAQLEPDAPPSGTEALYDRTPDGKLHVVSLLPGDVTPAARQNAEFQGASADGSTVAFSLESGPLVGQEKPLSLYVRVGDSRTIELAPGGADEPAIAGFSSTGRYVFYLAGGDLFRLDTETGSRLRVTETGDATVVNIPTDGGSAYFASPSVLTAGRNPLGQSAQEGRDNLYRWQEGRDVSFVATVTERDMNGASNGLNGFYRNGLGQWAKGVPSNSPDESASRTTADGSTMIFEAEADLTGYDSEGSAEIYRYDAAAGSLRCLSCDPTQGPASGSALLQAMNQNGLVAPVNTMSGIPNLSSNGRRAFFQSPDRLVPSDTDERVDVYEWEADGVGSCATPGGCLFLISSGKSARDNYLYGVSESGDDVFISTADLLNQEDSSETPSIYDARVNGGFAAYPARSECQGEACQPAPSSPPEAHSGSTSFHGQGNAPAEGGNTCTKPAHRAKALSHRARRLRAHARHLARKRHAMKRATHLRRKAMHLAHHAHGLSRQANRCRRAAR